MKHYNIIPLELDKVGSYRVEGEREALSLRRRLEESLESALSSQKANFRWLENKEIKYHNFVKEIKYIT